MKSEKTWQAQIFCGLRIGYTDAIFPIEKIYEVCQDYVDAIGWCVTITPTTYIYRDGNEPGAIIGIINYPRFPAFESSLRAKTIGLAKVLLAELEQFRLTIIFPEETILLEKD